MGGAINAHPYPLQPECRSRMLIEFLLDELLVHNEVGIAAANIRTPTESIVSQFQASDCIKAAFMVCKAVSKPVVMIKCTNHRFMMFSDIRRLEQSIRRLQHKSVVLPLYT